MLEVPSITWISKHPSQFKDGRTAIQRGTEFINGHTAMCGHKCDDQTKSKFCFVLGSYLLSQMPLPSPRGQEKVKVIGLGAVVGRTDTEGIFFSRSLWALAS